MIAYRIVRGLLRPAVGVFFRRIEVVGREHVPGEGEGPVLFCGNHPNALMDPALIVVSCGRFVHFVAKDTLFRNPVLYPFLKAVGAVPVRRRSDHPEEEVQNQSMFDRLTEVLAEGRAAGIFPEGISHDGPRLARLKSGAARLVLAGESSRPGLGVAMVPCGLHYVHRERFRSSVLVQFGPPLRVAPELVARYRVDAAGAVGSLTERIERSLAALTVNAKDWATLRVLDGMRRLYQPEGISLEQRVELARRFAQHYPDVRDEPAVAAIYRDVEAYLDRLAMLGLADADVRQGLAPAAVALRVLEHVVLVLMWMPLALAGAWFHGPLACGLWLAGRLVSSRDMKSTVRFAAGFVLLPLAYIVTVLGVGARWGPGPALWLAALLPLSGYAMLRVVERWVAMERLVTVTLRMARLGRELGSLRGERAALEASVVDLVERYRPSELVPLFPRKTAES